MTGYQSKRAAARDKLAEQQEPVAKYCCHVCFDKSGQIFLDRMILCPECGNKRCPKATNHALPCTNSNNPNQAGSVFTTPPQRTWVGLTDKERSGIEDYCEMIIGKAAFDAIEAKIKDKNNGT